MVYEIIGSRIVSPFIGTSTYVWTSLIGVILAALSLGYWLGGLVSDRKPDARLLAAAIFLAGGAVSVTVLVKDVVLSAIAAASAPIEFKAVLASVFLFAPASVLLGVVTPFAVKLRTLSLGDTGKTVGRLYALSTIGSIVGTFVAGFVLIPFFGSTRTLYLIAASLFGVSLLLAPLAFDRVRIALIVIFFFGVAGNELSAYYLYRTKGLVDIDTKYSRVQIFEADEIKTGRRFRAIATDPYFAQSAMYLDDGSPVFEYIPFYHLVRYFKPDHRTSLMIGGAGYSFPKEYLRTYPKASMDVVEIDPQMTDIAHRFFGLGEDPRLNIFHEDGRVFLDRSVGAKYDAVMVDAFGSLLSTPYHLTTVEAVRQMHRVLHDDGVVIVNIGSAGAGRASLFLQAEYATYRSVFPEVRLYKVRHERDDHEFQNIVLVACRNGCRRDHPGGDAQIDSLLSRQFDLSDSGIPFLTDDLAAVEYYNSIALSSYHH